MHCDFACLLYSMLENKLAESTVHEIVGDAVMQELAEEELDAISETLGDKVQLTGFYSYGEIAPMQGDAMYCQLHNQTMTLTTLYEL